MSSTSVFSPRVRSPGSHCRPPHISIHTQVITKLPKHMSSHTGKGKGLNSSQQRRVAMTKGIKPTLSIAYARGYTNKHQHAQTHAHTHQQIERHQSRPGRFLFDHSVVTVVSGQCVVVLRCKGVDRVRRNAVIVIDLWCSVGAQAAQINHKVHSRHGAACEEVGRREQLVLRPNETKHRGCRHSTVEQ